MKNIRKNLKLTAFATAFAAIGLAPEWALSESTTVTGPGALSTTPAARVDFSILIPRFLQFQVGTAAAVIDVISFTPTVAVLGNSVAQGGAGGNLGGGAVTVNVRANSGQVTITPTNNSVGLGLGNGVVGQRIAYTEILTASNAVGTLSAPVLTNAGGAAVLPTLTAGAVTNRTAIWTYTYANTTLPSAGTYGLLANGGRVTYTATTP